jgi:hypothetical protein
MRSISVTKDQEAVIRQFIAGCDKTGLVVGLTSLLSMIGYKVLSNGNRVHSELDTRRKYHETMDKFEDTFYEDWQELADVEVDADPSPRVETESN